MAFDQSLTEIRRAMFWTALVAECANEPRITGNRIVASLLRTDSVRAYCSRAGIDSKRAFGAMDEPHLPIYEVCARDVVEKVAKQGYGFGSPEHFADVQLRPLEPAIKSVFGRLFERDAAVSFSPLELILELMDADPALEQRLASAGFDAQAIRADIASSKPK